MRQHGYNIILLLFLALLCTGCTCATPAPTEEYRVVSQIDVVYQNAPIVAQMNFRDQEKMQQILFYLRRISPYGTPTVDPEQVQGSDFYITLVYSDQTKKTYHQRDDRFMRIDSGPWKRIDSNRALMLSRILGTMESDVDTTEVPFLSPST